MRKYYCDIYTGQSIVCFESFDVDSVLAVVKECIIPAQMISVYSYKENPYKHETIFANSLEEDNSSRFPHLSRFFLSERRKKLPIYVQTVKHYPNVGKW